ncbi:MAG: hypothetical protein H8E68_06625 [Kiritimatiellaeota bacterium]|nr:hypothetical protein [Kiritimatiellota bacterium]
MKRTSRNAWLWWTAITSLSIGIAIYILLIPAEYDVDVRSYRSLALVTSFGITGLCVIIGTRGRWFGKGL